MGIEEIRSGLQALSQPGKKYGTNKKEMDAGNFNAVVSDLNNWLELNDHDKLKPADSKDVARVMFHEFKNKFIEKNGKIGTYATSDLPTLIIAPKLPANPQYKTLTQVFTVGKGDYISARNEVASYLGITDKTHSAHGSNFPGTQTLRQIIENLYAKVSTTDAARVNALCIKHYRYDANKEKAL